MQQEGQGVEEEEREEAGAWEEVEMAEVLGVDWEGWAGRGCTIL